ncbi:hypothetical protein HJC22_11860 [Corallococcus exiguus]|uniref:hypothetical protein n=1 Tax=Corallococcus TaxID=83461 RepID=UPI000EA39601|nr:MULTISPECIES: hypothetical protein [Corallococcus]NNC16416.1 hypothetical protein [Corallococcus exiguus]NRD53879.1 hypothetical protein [Corallococcus exiguus]RKH26687.1 hypothetical protein D7V77_13990 [Corallococcus sp. CA041A]RKI17832.1 hypothetical protein D7Y15_09835 [Corallococcus sp. AB030]RUO91442.1 hypothetical protein D7Y11_19835 [Corallococcus sp. AB018]
MRYTCKNVSDLLNEVQGSPDVQGFGTSTFAGSTWNLVPSFGGGAVWQNYWTYQWTCEDGGTVTAEDRSTFGCY